MSSNFCVSDYHELLFLYQAVMAVKFDHDAGHERSWAGSPRSHLIITQLVEAIGAKERERGDLAQVKWWETRSLNSSDGLWQVAITHAVSATGWDQCTVEQKQEYAQRLLSPFHQSKEQIDQFVEEVDQRRAHGGSYPPHNEDEVRKLMHQMDRFQRWLFACDCAERVLPIFEAAYPGDLRIRQGIDKMREVTFYHRDTRLTQPFADAAWKCIHPNWTSRAKPEDFDPPVWAAVSGARAADGAIFDAVKAAQIASQDANEIEWQVQRALWYLK